MKREHMLSQREKRIKESIQRFRDYGVLTELELEKLHCKREYVRDYIKNHTYFSVAKLTGDFMDTEWNMSLIGQISTPNNEIRKLLIYSFKPVVKELLDEGLIERYNKKSRIIR